MTQLLITDDAIAKMLYGEHQMFDDTTKVSDFEFLGFDAKLLMKALIAKALQKGYTMAKFHEDMAGLCTLAAIRGFVIKKIMLRMPATGLAKLTVWISDYGIQYDYEKAVSLKREDITLPRICALFPLKYLQASTANFRYLGLTPLKNWSFPKAYCNSLGAIFCPPDYFEEWLKWAREYNFIINKGVDKDWEKTVSILKTQAANGGTYSEAVKAKVKEIAKAAELILKDRTDAIAYVSGDGKSMSDALKEVLERQKAANTKK